MRSVFDGVRNTCFSGCTVRVQARLGCLYLLPTMFLVPCVEALPALNSAFLAQRCKKILLMLK